MIIRPVTPDDEALLLTWRNDPATRAASRNTGIIEERSHQAWMERMLNAEDVLMLLAEDDSGHPIGHVRFDVLESFAEVSIVIAPELRGQGKGLLLLHNAHQFLAKNRPGVPVRAFVRSDNGASHRLFEQAGYTVKSLAENGSWYERMPDA